MNTVSIYHGVDAYDYTRSMEHSNQYTNLSDAVIKELVEKNEKWLKSGTIPAYIISIMDYEIGGEVSHRVFSGANPMKTKILLNVPAKKTQPAKKPKGVNVWGDLLNQPVMYAPEAPVGLNAVVADFNF